MNDLRLSKIKRFANDEAMVDAVREAMLQSFLKARANKEVHYLAAKSLAVEFLDEAFKELARHQDNAENESKNPPQIGL